MKTFSLLYTFLYLGTSIVMTDSLPYLSNYSTKLQATMQKRIDSLGLNYKPRTEHLNKDGSAIFVNSLIYEESPYLLQHAHNPVNWYAWSPKAFELATKANKPIFLSIGYATCHWCHVMEHESFENIEIAKFINQNFIAIKVDRERRTAVDTYYMTGVQMMTGHGGWPMSNFLTPDAKPFFGGTYYTPTQFITLLKRVRDVWNKQESELRKQAAQTDAAIQKYLSKIDLVSKIDSSLYTEVNQHLLSMHDDLQGGFSAAPKFPQEPWLLYLLTQNNKEIDKALQFTLNQMQQGGLFDQIGGGFHRYSVDNEWLVPHFEKMLYNQSQLGEVYTLAALKFNNPEYKRTAVATFDYVLGEMISTDGVFYSAGDADSEGEEGLFFTWTTTELKDILTKEEYQFLKILYSVSPKGNFESRTIFARSETLMQSANSLKTSYNQLVNQLDTLNEKLYKLRQNRVKPLIDNKAITSWNAQMIYSLASASDLLQTPNYLEAAIKASKFLLKNHNHKGGFLLRNSLNSKATNIKAELEDYAWLITALIKLYDITEEPNWLIQSKSLILQAQKLFSDESHGGFFDNILEENIPNTSRIKKSEDGASVSANGQMLIALARYIRRTGDLAIDELFNSSLSAFSGTLVKNPIAHTSMLRAKDIYQNGELSPTVYCSQGKVKIKGQRSGNKVEIHFAVKKGWHINSNLTAVKPLIPLSIESKESLELSFPQAKATQLDFNDSTLSTFDGEFIVTAKRSNTLATPVQLSMKLQACSDKICLAPSTVKLIAY